MGGNDEVNHPQHYQLFPDMEAFDVIKRTLSPEELRGYLKGNILKYRLRAGKKGDAEKCVAKADWYSQQLFDAPSPKAGDGCGYSYEVSGETHSLPHWARWIAQDKSGYWCAYENQPTCDVWDVWRASGWAITLWSKGIAPDRNPNWRDTLRRVRS